MKDLENQARDGAGYRVRIDWSRSHSTDHACNGQACIPRLCISVSQVTALQQQLQSSKDTGGRVDQQARCHANRVVMCSIGTEAWLDSKLRLSILHSLWKDRGKMELVTSRTRDAARCCK